MIPSRTPADKTVPDAIGVTSVRLGLAIGRHLPGYVDTHFGPADIAQKVEAEGALPVSELAAMQTTTRMLQGEALAFVDEVRALYGVTPGRADEAVFTEAHRVLGDLLPGRGTLAAGLGGTLRCENA